MKQQKKQKVNKYETDLPLKHKKRVVKEKYAHLRAWLDNETDFDNYSSFRFFEAGRA